MAFTAGLVRDVLQGAFGFLPDDPAGELGFTYLIRFAADGHSIEAWAWVPQQDDEEMLWDELVALASHAQIPAATLVTALLQASQGN